MEVKVGDIPVIQQFMGCFWSAIKKFYITEDSDEYWEYFCDYMEELHQKFPDPLCDKLIIAYTQYIEEKYRKEKKA